MSPDQLFSLRPIFGYRDYRSPVAGLYPRGSGTHPGGGVMGVPARNACRAILADVRRERLRARLRPAAASLPVRRFPASSASKAPSGRKGV
jgi:hypothetical protein